MHFGFDPDQEEIRRSAAELLARRLPLERVRTIAEAGGGDPDLWAEMVSLGWPALTVADEFGGVGLGLVSAVALLEQVGRALAPVPLLSDLCAALVIERAGSDEQRARWLPGLAAGELRATLGATRAGVCKAMPDAGGAAVFVFADPATETAWLHEAGEVTLCEQPSIDGTRSFFEAAARGGELLGGDVAGGLARAEVALAADLTGVAQRALEMTVQYVGERRQFGHPIGAFQGVSHRCAEMLALTEAARSATYYAAWAADAEPSELPAASAAAKATAARAACQVAGMAIQAHGGMGFTWEADVHWLFKRAYATAAQLTPAAAHRRTVARLAAGRVRASAEATA
jgi:alkylation response protein AidB-like acyl-CoA dehydrogenase